MNVAWIAFRTERTEMVRMSVQRSLATILAMFSPFLPQHICECRRWIRLSVYSCVSRHSYKIPR